MMDLELRISQYIDGELSGEEEGELHHMLAVSPEARALFREHLTLHTVARDERVLHRPTQSMRDDLFARLQSEEGMKSSAVVLASSVGGTALLSDTSGTEVRVAENRPPIASQNDSRTEERRRRRRLIPILIPLLLCVIVGGVWYGGGFGGGESENFIAAKTDGKNNVPTETNLSSRDPAGQTEMPARAADDPSLALHRPEDLPAVSSDAFAAASRSESSAASFRSRTDTYGDRAVVRVEEPPAMGLEEKGKSHDVLGISSSGASEDLLAENVESENTRGMDFDFRENSVFGAPEENSLVSPDEDSASLAYSSSALSPMPMFSAENGNADVIGEADRNSAASLAQADTVVRSEPFQSMAYNSIAPSVSTNLYTVRSGMLTDSSTGLPVTPTLGNYETIASMLEQNGLDADGDGKMDRSVLSQGPSNTGNRAIKDNPFQVSSIDVQDTWAANIPEAKGLNAPPIVMSEKSGPEPNTPPSDSLTVIASAESERRDDSPAPTSIRLNKRSASAAAAASADFEDLPLSPSAPRPLSFFVGLEQSVGATVSRVDVVLPAPTPSIAPFSGKDRFLPETRVVVGVDFDGGRQRAFAAVGAWAYDERTSFQSRTISQSGAGNAVVNRVTTTVGEERSVAYEIWGGAGYRYSVRMADHWNAGAEVWGGIGTEYVHAGFAVPVSYKLKENLHLEFAPGLRYRALHGDVESATTGSPTSDNFREEVVTPKDDHRVDASFGIGLILLLR